MKQSRSQSITTKTHLNERKFAFLHQLSLRIRYILLLF